MRSKDKSAAKSGRRLTSWQSLILLLFACAASFALIKFILWALNTPFFQIQSIEISQLNYQDESEIRQLTNFALRKNILRFNLTALEDSLRKLEYIRQARAYRALPHTIRLIIEEKSLLALFCEPSGLCVIDTDGKRAGSPRTGKVYDLPIIDQCPKSGEKYYRAVNFLRAAKKLSPPIYNEINQLTYNDDTLTALIGDYITPVFIGKKDFPQSVMKLWILINKSDIKLTDMTCADLRYSGKIFYAPK